MAIEISAPKTKLRICALVPYPTDGPANRYRVEQFLPAMEARGHTMEILPFADRGLFRILYRDRHRPEKLLRFASRSVSRIAHSIRSLRADVVFVHREAFPLGPPWIERSLRSAGVPLVYDIDDALWLHNPSVANGLVRTLKSPRKTLDLMAMADRVIAGNEFLAERARGLGSTTTVIPTSIDLQRYRARTPRPDSATTVIGWVGTTSSARYLASAAEGLARVAQERNIVVRLIGGSHPLPGVQVEERPWSLEREIEDLQELDIGIMPMVDEPWARGKCGFKIIQYFGVGVPAVATPIGVNGDLVRDGETGFAATTADEWHRALLALIDHPEQRVRMGLAGRELVRDQYSLTAAIPPFLSVFESLARRSTQEGLA